jgi:hypothetical protein
MELNYIDCASNLIKMKHPCGVHRLGDTIILHSNDEITAWDIGNPLDIRQAGACPIENSAPDDVLHEQKLYIYYRDRMQAFDVSDPRNIRALAPVVLDTPVFTLDFDREGTVWALTRDAAIGAFTMDGKFTEHLPAIPEMLEEGRYDTHLKVAGDLLAVAHQEYGAVICRKNAEGRLEFFKHVTKGSESCFGTPITPVCDNRMLLLVSFAGMTPIDVHDVRKIKKLKKFKPKYELRNWYGYGIIDCGRSSGESAEHDAHDILAYGEENMAFELYLLEVSPAGITTKDRVRLKHRKFDRAISGMFLKDDYLIFVGTLPWAKASSFEVYSIIK